MQEWLKSLNNEQYQAVITNNQPLLVLSGAGTGKTKVLTSKIAYLLINDLAYQENILAVTFSNRAASEMRERVINLIGDAPRIWIGTFHSICLRILRAYGQYVGFSERFIIIDTDEQKKIITNILKEQNIETSLASHFINKISLMKDTMECVTFDKTFNTNVENYANQNTSYSDEEILIKKLKEIEALNNFGKQIPHSSNENNFYQEYENLKESEKKITNQNFNASSILYNTNDTGLNVYKTNDFNNTFDNNFQKCDCLLDSLQDKHFDTSQKVTITAQDLQQNFSNIEQTLIADFQNKLKNNKRKTGDNAGNQYYKIYELYQEKLKQENAMDFGDLIINTINLFYKCPMILRLLRNKFRYILVDEYQDTNASQYLLIKMLKPDGQGLCCVGDDDQSIYSWRGAEISNIIDFTKDFPNAKTIKLEQNYRSTQKILSVATSIIANNQQRLGKTLWSDKQVGEPVEIHYMQTGFAESKFISENIYHKRIKQNLLYKDIAILIRTISQTREIEEKLIAYSIPYKIVGGLKFYERLEIKDMIAYLRLIWSKNDNLAFERIINTPKRNIGGVTVKTLQKYAIEHGLCLFDVAKNCDEVTDLRPGVKQSLKNFVHIIEKIKNTYIAPADIASSVLSETNYLNDLINENTTESLARAENIKELIIAMQEFATVNGFLDHVGLVMDVYQEKQSNTDKITIMTMHASKGLEFDVVYFTGWEEGLFPHKISIDEGNIEEERRLAYVAITRAKKNAIITTSKVRKIYGKWIRNCESRFIKEIDKSFCVIFGNENWKCDELEDDNEYDVNEYQNTNQNKYCKSNQDCVEKIYRKNDKNNYNQYLKQEHDIGFINEHKTYFKYEKQYGTNKSSFTNESYSNELADDHTKKTFNNFLKINEFNKVNNLGNIQNFDENCDIDYDEIESMQNNNQHNKKKSNDWF